MAFDLPYDIVNIWNGVTVSNENGIYTVKNAGYNSDTYDACQRLKEEWVTNANGIQLAKYSYGLGKAGERLTITESAGASETETTYQYDKLNRLVKEVIAKDGNELTNEYSYDKVSNRISKETEVKGELSALADIDSQEVQVKEGRTTYTYNALNQLVTEESPEGSITYIYDANGNLVKQSGSKTVDYSYDKENHLLRATIQQGNSVTIESYSYDYAGNRLSKTVNESSTTYYVNDTSTSLTQVVAETDKDGKETASYTRGDELLSMERGGKIWYYIYDGHGSTRLLTNEAGRITDRYAYDACGNLLKKEGDTENDFLYTGEQYNANTGLYYLRARYMDPSIGTFISMDSYQGSLYDPVSLHKYLYANANPVMYTDPSGYNAAGLVVRMEAENTLRASQIIHDSKIFRIGMKLLNKLWSIKAVEAVSYLATAVLLMLVIDDALDQRRPADAYDVAVEILQYALDSIEFICNEAGIASKTISARIKTAIYEAKGKGKQGGKDKGKQGKKGEIILKIRKIKKITVVFQKKIKQPMI